MKAPGREEFQSEAHRVTGWRRPLLVSHAKPDGDAIGSLVAMSRVLKALGRDPLAVVFGDVPDRYASLTKAGALVEWSTVPERGLDDRDGVLVLDTCSFSQLQPMSDWLAATALPIVVVDHHISRDDLHAFCLIDETAAATCQILHRWIQTVDWPLDPATAEALFVGIATDTGWFRHSNTDARVFEAARALVQHGVKPHLAFEHLFQHESEARFRLRAAAANRLELLADGRLAVTLLPRSVFAQTGATVADTEDLVNEALRIARVLVSIMMVEQEDGVVRVGLRSKAPADVGSPDIDVAAFARARGGGGHRRAAGVRMTGSLADVRSALVKDLAALVSTSVRTGEPETRRAK